MQNYRRNYIYIVKKRETNYQVKNKTEDSLIG
jgi:hypothetical protein